MKNQTFYAAVVLKNSEIEMNFGQDGFTHPPMSGYVALSAANKDNCTLSTLSGNTSQVRFCFFVGVKLYN